MNTHNAKRKSTVLPLHIDTTSFTERPSQNNIYASFWRRVNKRQLPIIFLLTILFCSLFLNLIQHKRIHATAPDLLHSKHDPLPPIPLTEISHAVIIAGHAIYTGASTLDDLYNEDNWVLEPYQKRGRQINTFVEHIQKGIDLLEQDPKAMLIFSGGETRPVAGPRSESLAYWEIAQILLGSNTKLSAEAKSRLSERMVTEQYARDSFENLLFSICRFSEMSGNYPSEITVVGFEFKRTRFEDLHRYAIQYPAENFNYVGIDPKTDDPAREEGELLNSYKPFERDLYGCHGVLKQKRIIRNPYRRRHAYAVSCPVLAPLINYCPANNALYKGPLPWIAS